MFNINQILVGLFCLWMTKGQDLETQTPPVQCSDKKHIYDCDVITIDGFDVHQPLLFPCCIASLIVGVLCGNRIYNQKRQGHLIYSVVFVLIGIMMTSAAVLHCFLLQYVYQLPLLTLDVNTIDEGLTTSIGLGFFICAMVDLGVVKDSVNTLIFFFLSIIGILYFDYTEMYKQKIAIAGMMYALFVLIGCGTWVIVQLILQISKFDCKGISYLIQAGTFGFIGFIGIFTNNEDTWLCEKFGCHISTDFIWFLVTPICAYLIYKFYIATHSLINSSDISLGSNNKTLLVPMQFNYPFNTNNNDNLQNNNSQQFMPRTELVSLQYI